MGWIQMKGENAVDETQQLTPEQQRLMELRANQRSGLEHASDARNKATEFHRLGAPHLAEGYEILAGILEDSNSQRAAQIAQREAAQV